MAKNILGEDVFCDICTTWQRMAAFVIDAVILVALGFILSLIFGGLFMKAGAWGRMIGFVIASLYFSIMDSKIGGGQTIGKRIMKIKLVNILGETTNPFRTFFRSSIILFPFFLYGIMLPPSALSSSAVIIITFLFLSVIIGLVYFYFFNKRTGQTFHDIGMGTYVVKTSLKGAVTKSGTRSRDVPSKHYFIYMLLVLVVLCLAFLSDYVMKKSYTDFGVKYGNVIDVNQEIVKQPGVFYSTFILGITDVDKDTGAGKLVLSCDVYTDGTLVEYEGTAKKLTELILKTFNDSKEVDVVHITFYNGFDIGIFENWDKNEYEIQVEK